MSHSEPGAKRSYSSPTDRAGADVVRTTMQTPGTPAGFAKKSRTPAQIHKDKARSIEAPWARRSEAIDPGHYVQHPFVRQLLCEKRRANRTKSPLSMALFRTENASAAEFSTAKRLYEVVNANRRETDIVALIGDDLIAVLLLDTDNQGARAYTQRMLALARNVAVSTIEQTYPDHLFENLEIGYQEISDPNVLVHEHSLAPRRKNFIPELLTAAKGKWLGMLGLAMD